jgi:hypothetical protein
MERTEEQKITEEVVKLTFGGKTFEVKPLKMKEAALWRKKFVELYNNISQLANITSDKPEEFSKAMGDMLLEKPEKIADLFFEYTKLNREEIEGLATSKEFLVACGEVFALEASFFGLAVKTIVNLQKSIL